MKNLETLSIQELKTLKLKIEGEIARRETQTICTWSIKNDNKKVKKIESTWEGETYIS